jgi:hypothetical protein
MFVYTASDRGDMIHQLIKSVQSLSRFVDKDEITVVLTPPYPSEKRYEGLHQYAQINRTENTTASFELRPGKSGRFGEKIAAVLGAEAREVIFLDCDARIRKNPKKLLYGDYSFSGRAAGGFLDFDINIWTQMFLDLGKTPIPMINAGFMIFRGGIHKKIMKEALAFFQNAKLPRCHHHYYHRDQYAITLAASGHSIKWMSRNEHGYRWKNEHPDTVILHGERRPVLKQLRLSSGVIKNYIISSISS